MFHGAIFFTAANVIALPRLKIDKIERRKTMKKDLLCSVFVLCLGLFLCSCSKNEKDDASLTGTWKVRTANKEKNQYAADVVWEAPSNLTMEIMGQKYPVNQLSTILTPIFGNMVNAALKDVTLTADGKVRATYMDSESNTWKTADGYATYKDEGKGRLRLFFTDKAFSRVDGLDDAREAGDLPAVPQAEVPRRQPPLGADRRRLDDDRPESAGGARRVVLHVPVGGLPVLGVHRVHAHRGQPQAIAGRRVA